MPAEDLLLTTLCECGCGLPTPLAKKTYAAKGHVKGQPLRRIFGHGTAKSIAAGTRFGRLTVIASAASRSDQRWYSCRCDCGEIIEARASRLRCGEVRSCGCLMREIQRTNHGIVRHGHALAGEESPTYTSWRGMVHRCTNPKSVGWKNYGGRGITVCERWRTFSNFLADMGERPEGKTIDRIDVDGNYEPENCRWATPGEQNANRRKARRAS